MDDIIRRLLEGKNGKQVQLTEGEIRHLCATAREIFISEPSLLELEAPMKICGDIHGQYSDLLRIFEYGGCPPASSYLFLGNYIDYGDQGIETLCLLLAYKIKYPKNMFLLRGNHECAWINRLYGFYDECKRRFNVRLWKVITDCFNCLPFAAIIDEKIFCVHGGLSPELEDLDQIRKIIRPTDIPDSGLLRDLLWADPEVISGWGENERGDRIYGTDVVSEFLEKHDFDLICRGNQAVEDGYEFFAKRRLVTIFTAPNFRGEYDNVGAILSASESLLCSFEVFKPCDAKQNKEGSSNNTLSSGAPPRRSELDALTALDAPNSSGVFKVLDARMSFDDAVLCSFQFLKPFDKKRKARLANITQQSEPPLPPPRPIRKAQKQ